MPPQINKLLLVFKRRAEDPSLRHSVMVSEVFDLCAKELEIAIGESEPPNLLAYVPRSCIDLVCEALHFNQDSDESWAALARAAIACQGSTQ